MTNKMTIDDLIKHFDEQLHQAEVAKEDADSPEDKRCFRYKMSVFSYVTRYLINNRAELEAGMRGTLRWKWLVNEWALVDENNQPYLIDDGDFLYFNRKEDCEKLSEIAKCTAEFIEEDDHENNDN